MSMFLVYMSSRWPNIARRVPVSGVLHNLCGIQYSSMSCRVPSLSIDRNRALSFDNNSFTSCNVHRTVRVPLRCWIQDDGLESTVVVCLLSSLPGTQLLHLYQTVPMLSRGEVVLLELCRDGTPLSHYAREGLGQMLYEKFVRIHI